jgi:hypothetical protein
MMEACKKLKSQYGEYGDTKVRGNGMAEFVLKKIPSKLVGVESSDKTKNNKTKGKKTTRNNKTKKNKYN